MIIPLLVVLLVSPALSRVINLTRDQTLPKMSSSRATGDSCRWYSIVYFIVWIGFVSMQSQAVVHDLHTDIIRDSAMLSLTDSSIPE